MDARVLMTALAGERARFVQLARRRVGSQADAEDVVQRALVHAAENAASVSDPARGRAWFYRLLRNAIADHHRRSIRDPLRSADGEIDDVAAATIPHATTPCRCSLELLDELRPSYAEVIRHVDVDGEAPAVAAAALGISQGNLDVRLHRARKTLRDDVRGYCGVTSHGPCLDCSCDGGARCGPGG